MKTLCKHKSFIVVGFFVFFFLCMFFVSAPEHKVLKGELLSSLCVRRASVRRASFKKWRQTFQTTSPPKPHGQLQPNFTEMILRWTPFKVVQKFKFH
jgi:hypothetical protein